MKGSRLSLTIRYVLVFGVLLFLANSVLGIVILTQSRSAMRSLIDKNMLDVAKSAAGSLDGDALGSLTEADVDGPVFREVEERLLVFQNSVDIHFIFAVKQVGDGSFVFTVDPDPVDPGAFGEECLTTPALEKAGNGTPAVDDKPAQDRWGNFYSAYCPVFDSAGNVSGVVGVDFDAEWYDAQLRQYSYSVVLVTSFSVATGAVIIGAFTNRVRRRFGSLEAGLEELSGDIDCLMDEISSSAGLQLPKAAPGIEREETPSDELGVLSEKVHAMQAEMRIYLDYLTRQAYTDSLTQSGNVTAYRETVGALDQRIEEGTADFCVIVFDLNGLKEINDTYGHMHGDQYIQDIARALEQGFGSECVFRVGGDEFVVIASNLSEEQVRAGLADVEATLGELGTTRSRPVPLTVSKGMSWYRKGEDASFKDVFSRADQSMYADKRAFYQKDGNDRRR